MIVKEIVFGENTEIREKNIDNDSITNWVSARWSNWSKDYNSELVLEYRQAVKPEKCDKNKDWHSNIKLNKPFSYYNKIYSIISNTIRNELLKYISVDEQYKKCFDGRYFYPAK